MECSANYIEDLIKNTPDGGICRLPKGRYFIKRPIKFFERRNITLDGGGSTLISHYNNGSSADPTCDCFHIKDCEGVKLCNLMIETDTPVNITGTVEQINRNEGFYVLAVDPEFKVTGKEIFMMQNGCDADGSFVKPDYYCTDPDKSKVTLLAGEILLANTHTGCKYDYLKENRYRVFLPKDTLSHLYIGQTICVRHSSYGPICILIKSSRDTVLENITIYSGGGMGVVVLPRSENLTLKNFNALLPENTKRMMSLNCDGVHITGLCGKLSMKDCDFEALGDDALNIHSTAATVTATDAKTNTLKCNYCKKRPDGLLSPDWCKSGDTITVLDPETCRKSGEFKVVSFRKDQLIYENLSGEIKPNDVLQNTAFSAAVEVVNCRVRNTRARALILQTENITVKDCRFYGMSGPAIKAAPDLVRWYEVGPIKKLRIQNNTFEKCGFTSENDPILAVQDNHDTMRVGAPGVHENIAVLENTFIGKSGRCIFVTSTNGVTVKGNRFEHCTRGEDFIELKNCSKIERD